MIQTDHTAIVVRSADYRENDRMLTLFSPVRGKVEVLSRGCRKPKSHLLAASQMFALGDFEMFYKSERNTLTGATLIENFYPIRTDFDKLTVGTYLLNICEIISQPGQPAQELFMLLLHTLSRLSFSDQEWRPLLAGFLIQLSAIEGFQPELEHCTCCGKPVDGRNLCFDLREGGVICSPCREEAARQKLREKILLPESQIPLASEQWEWMKMALQSGASCWVNSPEMYAPLNLLRKYVESRLDQPIRAAKLLPVSGENHV